MRHFVQGIAILALLTLQVSRITSYNVCYTKLLRINSTQKNTLQFRNIIEKHQKVANLLQQISVKLDVV